MVTITGRDVISKIQITDEQRTDKLQRAYYIGTYAGKGFTVTPEFREMWKAGRVLEVNLTEAVRKVPNPELPGQFTEREAFTFSGYITYDQMKGIVKNEAELKVVEAQALAALKLDDTKVAALQESI